VIGWKAPETRVGPVGYDPSGWNAKAIIFGVTGFFNHTAPSLKPNAEDARVSAGCKQEPLAVVQRQAATVWHGAAAGLTILQQVRRADHASRSIRGVQEVTVLFADVVRSMDIAAAPGAERLREIMAELADRCAAVVERYGGTVDRRRHHGGLRRPGGVGGSRYPR
jgi:hypothetical protein